MNLQQIRAFIALAEELHFTRAAERLEISQPQFSQLIRRLEEHLEVTLVERTTRRVVLTAAGQAALPHAKSCPGDAVDSTQRTGSARGYPRDCSTRICRSLFTSVAANYRQ